MSTLKAVPDVNGIRNWDVTFEATITIPEKGSAAYVALRRVLLQRGIITQGELNEDIVEPGATTVGHHMAIWQMREYIVNRGPHAYVTVSDPEWNAVGADYDG
jgi:hypothetical protein